MAEFLYGNYFILNDVGEHNTSNIKKAEKHYNGFQPSPASHLRLPYPLPAENHTLVTGRVFAGPGLGPGRPQVTQE